MSVRALIHRFYISIFPSMRFLGIVLCFQLVISLITSFLAIPVCAAKYRVRNPNTHFILRRPIRAEALGDIENSVLNRTPNRRNGNSNLLKMLHDLEELLEHMDYHMEHDEEHSVEKRGDRKYPVWWQYQQW